LKILKIILLILIVNFSILLPEAKAQKHVENLPKYDFKKYHFGFTLGFNEMNFVVKPAKDLEQFDTLLVIESVPDYGFNIGIVSSVRLFEYLDLRFVPTLSFGDRIIEYSLLVNETEIVKQQKRTETTNIDFPLTLKYKSKRLTNTRAYVVGGIRYSIDLASQYKKKANEQDVLVKLYQSDYSFEVGAGFDFFLQYFKFGIEIKMIYGIRDLLKREDNIYTQSIDKLSSKIFWLTFTFE